MRDVYIVAQLTENFEQVCNLIFVGYLVTA